MFNKNIRNTAIISLFLLLLAFFLQCSGSSQYRDQQKVFMWKVETNRNTVFILGSIHAAKKALFPFDKRIEDAYSNSHYVAFEVDSGKGSLSEMNHYNMKYGLYPNPVSLKDKIPHSLYVRVDREFRKYGYSINQFAAMRPWLVAQYLRGIRVRRTGYSAHNGVDLYFETRSRGRKKILELEDREKHASVFGRMNDDVQIMMLEDALKDRSMDDNLQDKLNAYWRKGDTINFYKIYLSLFPKEKKYESYYNKLLIERNYIIADKIHQYLQDSKTYFVVVGAGHLVGRESIIEILRNKGYNPVQM